MEEKVERLPILKPNADLPITKETQGKTDNLETEDVDELWETWQESLLPDQSETLLWLMTQLIGVMLTHLFHRRLLVELLPQYLRVTTLWWT